MNDFISICSWLHLGYVCRFMQPSVFQGCSLLRATGNFSSVPPPILHFTRSSTHSNVHEAARLEGNWIKSNRPEIARSSAEKEDGSKKGKGICYLTPASHLSWLPGDNLPLGEGKSGGLEAQHKLLWKLPWWCKSGQPSPCPCEVGFFFSSLDTIGPLEWQEKTSAAGEEREGKAASVALVLIDIPSEESEYSNVSKLCYLTRESAEIRG